MARLGCVKWRAVCAVCGETTVFEEPRGDEAKLSPREWPEVKELGWRSLARDVLVCPKHGGESMPDEKVFFLKQRARAYALAERFMFPFFLAEEEGGAKIVTASASREATPEEIAMWYVLMAKEQRPRE